jgi:16S rRNA G966 N2-methylase RsmD
MADWERICDSSVQEFIFKNEHGDEHELVLNHKTLFDLPAKSIAEQIAGRRKAKKKLPMWYNTRGIVYPPSLNLEQSSSQATAAFKSKFLKEVTHQKTITDLTGGFGVDSFFFSKEFELVTYVEPNAELLAMVQHNQEQLHSVNIQHHNTKAEEFLSTSERTGIFYLDPARRDANAKKIFKLSDCTPDITQLLTRLFANAEWIVLKASPLLDIQQGLRELPHVKTVIALAVENEMKELLFLAESGFNESPEIVVIDLDSDGEVKSKFTFTHAAEATAQAVFSEPLRYLYEPNVSLLKAGAFKLIAQLFNLNKLAPNTHLYTSQTLMNDFPGRTFLIEQLNPTDKQLKECLPDNRAHVAIRNYPLTAQQLMKKLKLQEGGDQFVWGFSAAKRKYVALCKRIV